MTLPDIWHTDRTRYLRGFECRWKRLLEFHAFGTGIRSRFLDAAMATGRYTHLILEKLFRKLKDGEEHDNWMAETNMSLVQVLASYQDEVEKSKGFVGEEVLDAQLDMVVGMSHGYARAVLPFVQANFDVVAVEQEMNLHLPANIIWMARPDFVARSKADGKTSVHDFKSTSYWDEQKGPKQWHNSIQMMANAKVASESLSTPVSSYYMHMMVKGNKKYPSLLTHAYCRPGNPPFSTEEWRTKWTREKTFSRVRVADFRPLPEWIWAADGKDLGNLFPVVGPYTVHDYTVSAFFHGVEAEERWWQEQTEDFPKINWAEDWSRPEFQQLLDKTFPRTYACHDFSGRRCQFYDLCHKAAGWEEPLGTGLFERRTPHHPQEGEKEKK